MATRVPDPAADRASPRRRGRRAHETGPPLHGRAGESRWTIDGLLEAKSAAAALFDELGLEGYLFEIEPRADDLWEIRIEWVRGGPSGVWSETRLTIDGDSLVLSRADRAVRARILRAWRERLGGEPREPGPASRRLRRAASERAARSERRPRGIRRARA